MTSLVNFGPKGPSGLLSQITCYVNAKQRDRASGVRIQVDINNRQTPRLDAEWGHVPAICRCGRKTP
jgi:hypothetical protein